MKPVFTPSFERSVSNLKKRYRHLVDDLSMAIKEVLATPNTGTGISHGCRKLRYPNTDAGRGKSGGYRIIYLVNYQQKMIYFLLIYSKSDKDDVTEAELRRLISETN